MQKKKISTSKKNGYLVVKLLSTFLQTVLRSNYLIFTVGVCRKSYFLKLRLQATIYNTKEFPPQINS